MTGERDGYFTLFRRNEGGTMTNAGRIRAHGADIRASNDSWPFVTDWDEDGRKDLLVGQEGLAKPCNIYVYLNQGADSAPVFNDSTPVRCAGSPLNNWRAVAVTEDLDRDGRKDLVMGEFYSSVRLYRNEGTNPAPVFNSFSYLVLPDSQRFSNGNPPRVNFCDWDGDGDRDMVTCDYYGGVFLRRNMSAGVEERLTPQASRTTPEASIVRGVLRLAGSSSSSPSRLVDAAGRGAMKLRPGENDVSHLAPGIYYLCDCAAPSPVRRIVLAR